MPRPATTLALCNGNEIQAVVAFFNFDGISMEGAIAGVSGWAHRPFIRRCFSYVFDQAGCRRFHVRVEASNEVAHRMDLRLGFKHEGTLRQAARDGGDVHILGMLRSEYETSKWVKDGQKFAKTAADA